MKTIERKKEQSSFRVIFNNDNKKLKGFYITVKENFKASILPIKINIMGTAFIDHDTTLEVDLKNIQALADTAVCDAIDEGLSSNEDIERYDNNG